MKELIDFVVEMMIQENMDPEENPSQNPDLNPSQNPDINVTQNREINSTQIWELAPSQNPNWKQAWWKKFQELIFWDYLNDSQKQRCLTFLKRL